MPITPPKSHIKSTLARKAFDGIVAGVPFVGGPLAGIYGITFPGKSDLEIAKWRNDVCALFNSLEEQIVHLTKEIPLSDNAISLGFWLAENSVTGRSDFLTYEEITEAFPNANKLELLEAVGELELSNLVGLSKAIGVPFRGVRTNFKLLEIFDPLVFESVNPRIDASFIAKKLLESDKTIGTKAICDETGWSVRRINPALLIVGQYISEGRKSSPTGQPYAIRSMFIDPKERALLRRFVENVDFRTPVSISITSGT